MTAPAFSVVVPAYQAEDTLASAIRSVLDQTRQDFELVIVDDGSSDGTAAIAAALAREDERIRVVWQENRGLAAARNSGIANTGAPLIALLDSDDLWMPTFLEEMAETLDSRPDAGFAYTDGWALDAVSKRIRRTTVMARQRPPMPPPRDSEAFLLEMVKRNFIPAEGTLRRSVIERLGPYREELPAVEDYELWLRMLAHGYGGARTNSLLLLRREAGTSMSKDIRVMLEAHLQVMRILVEELPVSAEVRAAAAGRIDRLRANLAKHAGERPAGRALERMRSALGRARWRLLGGAWLQEPPAEVAAAFPDLAER